MICLLYTSVLEVHCAMVRSSIIWISSQKFCFSEPAHLVQRPYWVSNASALQINMNDQHQMFGNVSYPQGKGHFLYVSFIGKKMRIFVQFLYPISECGMIYFI